jgi:hypothetical protein
VCCIGDEAPVLIHQQPHSLEQAVDRGDEWMQLAGHTRKRQWCHVIGASYVEITGQPDHRAQRVRDDKRRDHHQAGNQRGDREQRAKRHTARGFVSNSGRLYHGEPAAVGSRS